MKLLIIRSVCITVLIGGLQFAITQLATGQDASPKQATKLAEKSDDDKKMQALLKKFEERMSGSKLIGQFTIDGQTEQKPNIEEYHLLSVRKMEKPDVWEFKARIKYGKHDLTVPLPIEVKWAAGTPVITVNQLFVPGLGTFDARVLLRKDKYAGTWSHDNVGGHMFGRIEKLSEEDLKKTPSKRNKSGDSGSN